MLITHRLWRIAPILALLLSALSCQRQEGVYAYESVNAEGWHYDSAAVIAVDTLRTTATYQPELHVRLTQHYPYDALWVVVEQAWTAATDTVQGDTPVVRTLAPALMRRDTLRFRVSPEGTELTENGLSRLHFQLPMPALVLHAGQVGNIRIKPAMQVHRLRGVSDVGVRLQPQGHEAITPLDSLFL